jgi:hypothetical protein
MSCANMLNPVVLYCPTHSKHIACALCDMLGEQIGFRGNVSQHHIAMKEGRNVTNASGKTVII